MIDISADSLLPSMLRTLRQTLNHHPEVAGKEQHTSTIVSDFLKSYHPDGVCEGIGGYGVAAIYEGRNDGPTVMVRAELDALAVERRVNADGQPCRIGQEDAAHLCGHDGHMTIVAGLAPLLCYRRPVSGRVILLFQPAEETGEGAERVLQDPQFTSIAPDYALALHNLPGYPADSIIVRRHTFSCASIGMRIEFEGQSAHAAEPERALSPVPVVSALLQELPQLSNIDAEPFQLVTITHARVGRMSFGLTPGRAELFATLRAETDEHLAVLREQAEAAVTRNAASLSLPVKIGWAEGFPAVYNDDSLVTLLEEVCPKESLPLQYNPVPMRWSEDFGHFSQRCPSLFFGLGMGSDCARLHQPGYQFSDSCIDIGMRVFYQLIDSLLGVT